MDIKNIVRCGIPYTGELVCHINEGEIPLAPGDYKIAERLHYFESSGVDLSDRLKVRGITADGTVYVSDKDPLNLTDDEVTEYFNRKDSTEDFSEDILINEPFFDENSEYVKDRASY